MIHLQPLLTYKKAHPLVSLATPSPLPRSFLHGNFFLFAFPARFLPWQPSSPPFISLNYKILSSSSPYPSTQSAPWGFSLSHPSIIPNKFLYIGKFITKYIIFQITNNSNICVRVYHLIGTCDLHTSKELSVHEASFDKPHARLELKSCISISWIE